MIDYKNITLSVYDNSNNKVGTLYAPEIPNRNFASDILIVDNGTGWKELTFSIPKKVDGETNPLVEFLVNEYIVFVDDGVYKDKFIISEPNLAHVRGGLQINAKCNHLSARLRTKKLSLVFDDTNGIGTINQIATIILQGTGWTLGTVDTFYEPDGTTQRVRSLKTSGKDGAYQLIVKLCELFNARPVFNGANKTVDLLAFAPYVYEGNNTTPTLSDPEKLIELDYGQALEGITRSLDTENMVTRLFVEGTYTDSGYLGIESVEPNGLNFLLNFDYLQSVGLLKPEHTAAINAYKSAMTTHSSNAKQASLNISSIETELMKLWGTADYSIFNITSKVSATSYNVTHATSLGENIYATAGDTAVVLFTDRTHFTTKVASATLTNITLTTAAPGAKTANRILVYRKLASGSVGGKELAIQSAEEIYNNLTSRIGDNLVADSDKKITIATGAAEAAYTLTDDWPVGSSVVVSIWGTLNTGQSFRIYRDNGTTLLGDAVYDTARRVHVLKVASVPTTTAVNKKALVIKNHPAATASSGVVNRVKVEYGTEGTYWSPAANSAESEQVAEYEGRINVLYNGTATEDGLYEQTADAVDYALSLHTARQTLTGITAAIGTTENTFSNAMGDLLMDGYWQNSNYDVGQEQNLYDDAVEILKTMSKPVKTYSINVYNYKRLDGTPIINGVVNAPVHIIDDDAEIDDWGYVEKASYYIDAPQKNTISVTTKEAKYAGQSFTDTLSKIAEVARETDSMSGVYKRASAINKFGNISTEALEGIIDAEKTKILSSTSNWYTDERGAIVFLANDGTGAMMLTGEGFMIADSKTSTGEWNWRT